MAMKNMVTENMEMREREISLRDLLVEVLLHWRMMLVVMLLGGIVMGGFSYGRSLRVAKNQERMLEEQQQMLEEQQGMSQKELMEQWEAQGIDLREQLDEAQLERIYAALELRQCYEEWVDYQQHSLLMQMDSSNMQQADLSFAIRAEDADCAYGAESAYEHLLLSAVFYEYIEELYGFEDSISELISLRRSQSSVPQSSILVLSVRVLHDNADICSDMADAVEGFILQQQKELEQTIGSHDVILLSRSQVEVVSQSVANLQNTCANTLYTLSNNYSNLVKNFGDEELAYYNYLSGDSLADNVSDALQEDEAGEVESAAEDVNVRARVSVKYVLLGIILFACIYFFVFFIKYIMNNRLRSTDSLCELYGIPQLGTVPALFPKRFLSVVDQWILKLRYHNQRRFTPEESTELAAVAVKMAALKKGAGKICLLGCELKGNTLEICGRIKGQLEAVGLEVNTLNNVLYDAEAMERLCSVESVVLVETAGVTLYDEILKELELLRRQEITVLGGIVAE